MMAKPSFGGELAAQEAARWLMPLNPLRRASVRSVKPISYHKGRGARRRFARFAAVFQGEVQKRVSRASRPPPTAQLRPCTRPTPTLCWPTADKRTNNPIGCSA